MKRLSAIAVLLSVSLSLPAVGGTTLVLKSGYVRYNAHLKTMGVGGGEVTGVNRGVSGRISVADGGKVEGALVIAAVGFDSNNTKRDKDVTNILKYKEHPAITVEVVEMAPQEIERALGPDSGQVHLKARITAGGGSKIYDVTLAFHPADGNTIRFTTHIDAKFSDFGIKPPSFGLILRTASDTLDLDGDLVFEVEKAADGGP